MAPRNTVRTIVTVGTALCIATMFIGPVAALDTGGVGDAVNVGDSGDSAPVDVGIEIDGDQSDSGGSGTGEVVVESDQANASGSGSVGGDTDDGLTIDLGGEGESQGEEVDGALSCDVSPDETNPEEACTATPPSGDAPGEPGEDLPVDPVGDAPSEPNGDLPIDPGDGLPIQPGEDLPVDPGGEIPVNAGNNLPSTPEVGEVPSAIVALLSL